MATCPILEFSKDPVRIVLRWIDDTDNSDVPGVGKVVFDLSDVSTLADSLELTGDDLVLKARLDIFNDADDGCTRKARIIFASGAVPYDGE